MRVLVTRPATSGAQTAERLKALGHEPVLLPLFVACHLPVPADAKRSAQHSGLIFTSAEAIRGLEADPGALHRLRALQVFTVGKATARAATAAGFISVRTASGDGKSLARLVAETLGGHEGGLLYLAGEPRSPHLEDALLASGIPVDTHVIYRMKPIMYTERQLAEAIRDIDVVLLYSREAALRFVETFRTIGIPEQARFVCLSTSIEASLPEAWAARSETAADMAETAMLERLAER